VTEARRRAWLAETKRESDLALHALIVEAVLGWDRRSRQEPHRFRVQLQFSPAIGKNIIGTRDRSRRADAATRRDFKIARINAALIKRYRGARVRYERSVNV
jgi:hypothetical protein